MSDAGGDVPERTGDGAPSPAERDERSRGAAVHDRFDGVAARASDYVSRAPFFLLCVVLVLIWLPSFPLFDDLDSWQFPMNTVTAILTFLLVALLENSQRRSDHAIHRKLDAIAEGVADLMHHFDDAEGEHVDRHLEELRSAAGIRREPTPR